MKTSAAGYLAAVRLTNSKSGKVFDPGDPVSASDFPADVIKHWLASGRLIEISSGSASIKASDRGLAPASSKRGQAAKEEDDGEE